MSLLQSTQAKDQSNKLAYKIKEVADLISVTPITVRRLIERGELKPVRSLRHVLISRAEIERFLTGETA